MGRCHLPTVWLLPGYFLVSWVPRSPGGGVRVAKAEAVGSDNLGLNPSSCLSATGRGKWLALPNSQFPHF